MPDPGGPTPPPDDLEAALARFYDQESRAGTRRVIELGRVARRDEFVALLAAEGRVRVVEVGLGTGLDAAALLGAGLAVAGVDLSDEHVQRCRALGVDAHRASATALPFGDASFDAGWSMSTLLHLPDDEADVALAELVRVVVPGGPVAIGLWGGFDEAGVQDRDPHLPHRWFRFRTDAQVRATLATHGTVERFDTWQPDGDRFTYQWAVLRTPDATP